MTNQAEAFPRSPIPFRRQSTKRLVCNAFRGLFVLAAVCLVAISISNSALSQIGSGGLGGLGSGDDPSMFEINFQGGTIQEFVELLRQKPYVVEEGDRIVNKPLNIIVTEAARDFRLPEIKIKTDMDGALIMLESLGDARRGITMANAGSEVDILVLDVDSDYATMVEVINAKQLLEKTSEEDLLSAIEIGFKMDGRNSIVQLKLHKETGLLFVRGDEVENSLVREVVKQMKEGLGMAIDRRGASGLASPGGMGMGRGLIGGADIRGGDMGGAGMGGGAGIGPGGGGAGGSAGNRKGGGIF